MFKLLGVHISDNLKWAQHVDALASKVASRLYFLKQLKKSGASTEVLICFYVSVIRPVLEYACPVWHSGLTTGQSDTDTDTLLKITQQTCVTTIRIIQCNDNDTRKSYNVKRHQLTNECLKALRLHCSSM